MRIDCNGPRIGFQMVLTRKGERTPTLTWHYKIPHTRISRDLILTDNLAA